MRSVGAGHHFIPPGACTWQGVVETVHRLQEDEFFDRETFSSPADFWSKTTLFWHHFNLTRRNRAKEWQTPAQIVHTKNPHLNPAVLSISPEESKSSR